MSDEPSEILKVTVPSSLVVSLRYYADKDGDTLSLYVWKVLMNHIEGRTGYQDRPDSQRPI